MLIGVFKLKFSGKAIFQARNFRSLFLVFPLVLMKLFT
jgi:hypothetical protein